MTPKEVKRFRKPILDAMKRSPFEGILAHAEKVLEVAEMLPPLVSVYIGKDYEKAHAMVKKISRMEYEADLIKQDIRGHLPRSFFMPAARSDLLLLIKEQDRIADVAEDVAKLMDMRPTTIPEPIAGGFRLHVKHCVETVRHYRDAVLELNRVLDSAFRRKDIDRLMELVQEVNEREHEADDVERKITRKLFEMEAQMKPVALIHLLKIVDHVDQVANCAEAAANRLVSIVAR